MANIQTLRQVQSPPLPRKAPVEENVIHNLIVTETAQKENRDPEVHEALLSSAGHGTNSSGVDGTELTFR